MTDYSSCFVCFVFHCVYLFTVCEYMHAMHEEAKGRVTGVCSLLHTGPHDPNISHQVKKIK